MNTNLKQASLIKLYASHLGVDVETACIRWITSGKAKQYREHLERNHMC